MEIDVDRLRDDLKEYFTGAYFCASPVALVDLIEVESMTDDKIIQIALQNGFDLDDYTIDANKRM